MRKKRIKVARIFILFFIVNYHAVADGVGYYGGAAGIHDDLLMVSLHIFVTRIMVIGINGISISIDRTNRCH